MNLLQTNDGVAIYFRNCGVAPDSSGTVRVVPDFEAPNASAYAWLNTGKFVGTRVLDPQKRTLTMTIYDVSNVMPPFFHRPATFILPKMEPIEPVMVSESATILVARYEMA